MIMPQASLARARRFEQNLKEYQTLKEEQILSQEEEALKADKERDAELLSAVYRTAVRHGGISKQLEEYEELFHKNFVKVITGVMALVTTEALLLDNDVDKEAIYEAYQEAFEYLYENDQILLSTSPVFERLGGRAVTYIGGAQEVLSDEELSNVISNIYVNDPEMIQPLVSNIQDKVATCITDEKRSILAKNNLTEDQLLVENFLNRKSKAPAKPLFRKLLEDGVNQSVGNLNVVTSLSEEATTEVMESSLTNAIVTYTLLECLNTSKLTVFPEEAVDSYINYK